MHKNLGTQDTDWSYILFKSAISFRAWRKLHAQGDRGPNIFNNINLTGTVKEHVHDFMQAAGSLC